MRADIELAERTSGSSFKVCVHRFAAGAPGPSVYIQAGLHADEIPGLIVATHLIAELARLERDGALRREVVVVPACNPIGLAQRVLGEPEGRFDLASGGNFNRGFPDLSTALLRHLKHSGRTRWSQRDCGEAIRQALGERQPTNVIEELQHLLLDLSADADTVLDLHCDHDGELHLYAPAAMRTEAVSLGRLLAARVLVLTSSNGEDLTFEDACALPQQALGEAAGDSAPARFVATVELRGQRDVADDLAARDCGAILAFLTRRGAIAGEAAAETGPEPFVVHQDAIVSAIAPKPGVLLFAQERGEEVAEGETVATLVDPLSGERTFVAAPKAGRIFSRTGTRYAVTGVELVHIAAA